MLGACFRGNLFGERKSRFVLRRCRILDEGTLQTFNWQLNRKINIDLAGH